MMDCHCLFYDVEKWKLFFSWLCLLCVNIYAGGKETVFFAELLQSRGYLDRRFILCIACHLKNGSYLHLNMLSKDYGHDIAYLEIFK